MRKRMKLGQAEKLITSKDREERMKRIEEMMRNRMMRERERLKPGMLKGGQAKLDKNKNNRIDAQDFKILRAEKAKGRGKGLQDEKMKPGKMMKAALGTIALGKFSKSAAKKMGNKKMAPAMMGGIGVSMAKAKKIKEITGLKRGRLINPKGPGVIRPKPQDRYGRPFKPKPMKPGGKMGGGMMMTKPGQMSYYGGGMMMRPNPMRAKGGVMVKTKIGKNKPTKTY
jgi:hypothetical protein